MTEKYNGLDLIQTAELAEKFAVGLTAPAIVLLQGDLGSGKTTFVKSVVKALGGQETVTSPTFTLMNSYQAKFPIYHFDMYRLASAEDAINVGFAEYFDKKSLDGVCFVEWPENVEGLINEVDYIIQIYKEDDSHREIVITKGEK